EHIASHIVGACRKTGRHRSEHVEVDDPAGGVRCDPWADDRNRSAEKDDGEGDYCRRGEAERGDRTVFCRTGHQCARALRSLGLVMMAKMSAMVTRMR